MRIRKSRLSTGKVAEQRPSGAKRKELPVPVWAQLTISTLLVVIEQRIPLADMPTKALMRNIRIRNKEQMALMQ